MAKRLADLFILSGITCLDESCDLIGPLVHLQHRVNYECGGLKKKASTSAKDQGCDGTTPLSPTPNAVHTL